MDFFFEGGDEAEKSAYWSFLQKVKYYSILETLHVCIVPSYKCNLRCIYCFEPIEELSEINSILNFEMLEPFLERLENTFKYSNLRVVLYGGEPLYNRKILFDLIGKLQEWCDKKRKKITFGIMSNGTLANPDVISKLVSYGLEEIQITLDGVQEINDMRRKYQNGRGSFCTVYKNLLKCLEFHISVILRVNLDESNVDLFADLLSLLKLNGIIYKRNFKLSLAAVDPVPFRGACKGDFSGFLRWEKTLKKAWNVLISGVDNPDILIRFFLTNFSVCNAKIYSSFIIAPDGKLYSCYSLVGYDTGVVGHIESGLDTNHTRFMLEIDKNILKCLEDGCPFLPLCNGGCFYKGYAFSGEFWKSYCFRSYFENVWLNTFGEIVSKIVNFTQFRPLRLK
ncbi:MAG: radical SAM protein [candidate division WOR-3 bacterium]